MYWIVQTTHFICFKKLKSGFSYGALGNRHFPIGVSDIAAAITAYGRCSLLTLNESGNKVNRKIANKDIVVSNFATDCCVDGSTNIKLENGDIKIKDLYDTQKEIVKSSKFQTVKLVENLSVLSYNINNKVNEYKEILYVSKTKSKQKRYKITYDDKEIITTEEHRFYVTYDKKEFWCEAKDLQPYYEIIKS